MAVSSVALKFDRQLRSGESRFGKEIETSDSIVEVGADLVDYLTDQDNVGRTLSPCIYEGDVAFLSSGLALDQETYGDLWNWGSGPDGDSTLLESVDMGYQKTVEFAKQVFLGTRGVEESIPLIEIPVLDDFSYEEYSDAMAAWSEAAEARAAALEPFLSGEKTYATKLGIVFPRSEEDGPENPILNQTLKNNTPLAGQAIEGTVVEESSVSAVTTEGSDSTVSSTSEALSPSSGVGGGTTSSRAGQAISTSDRSATVTGSY